MKYTAEQEKIFNFVKNGFGSGIIDAVAGAGKTTTIIESAQYLKDHTKTLFCAFNKSIANEIGKKFSNKGMDLVTVRTIHSLGYAILKSNLGSEIKLNENKYRVLIKDSHFKEESKDGIENILQINNLDPNHITDKYQKYAIKNLLYVINNRLLEINYKFRSTFTRSNFEDFKNMVLHFSLFNEIEVRKANFDKELKEYYNLHLLLLEYGNSFSRKTLVVDFIDMLYLPIKWKFEPNKVYDFVFVDECQDLSKSQLGIVLKHASKSGRMLSVGDPRQSIYGFTGADIESFDRVKQASKAKALQLTKCFRCPKKIIDIAKTIREDIVGAKKEEGEVITIESSQIIDYAKEGDLIISRMRAPLIALVFDFIDKNTQVRIHEDEVKEIINELKLIFKKDELSANLGNYPGGFEQFKAPILERGQWIIHKNAERIVNKTERELHINDEISFLNRKVDFIQKKYAEWKQDCTTIFDILKKVKIFIDKQGDAIKLSTIHRAKGLEEKRVFILDYDMLPILRPSQKGWEITQEVNLKYVAVTRALESLFLVNSEVQCKFLVNGESMFDESFF